MTIQNSYLKYQHLPRHQLELLLAHIFDQDRLWVLTHNESQLSDKQQKNLAQFVDQLMSDTPLAYIVGYKRFYDVDFIVNHHVLIPRQETEELVQHVWDQYGLSARAEIRDQNIKSKEPRAESRDTIFADVGTGSGCIGLTLARLMPEYQFYLTDISKQALMITQANYQRQSTLSNVKIFQGNLLESLVKERIYPEVIIANLPYISAELYQELPANVVRYEPRLALDGGKDGLQLYRELLAQINSFYQDRPWPQLWLEISPEQSPFIASLFVGLPQSAHIKIIADLNQRDRFVYITFSHL